MQIRYLKSFKKQYRALPAKFQKQFDDRLRLFMTDSSAPILRIHPLRGTFSGYWSMNISGDLRAIYRRDGDEIVIFVLIGTHSQLYG
ncbi:MAG: type II toxin-antitoxin system RelE/ParE family toxin [Candidatus Saccharibacteria bacterium]|nr:type II toxin-antitoxin system RelE/ParE family toxin [Candidatus Saccharibacteria bacterium]